jgi:uncharacterized membrane protein
MDHITFKLILGVATLTLTTEHYCYFVFHYYHTKNEALAERHVAISTFALIGALFVKFVL